jgi:hypothetical protein
MRVMTSPGSKSLQVSERAGAHRLNHHAGSVELGCGGGRYLANHDAQLGLAGVALVVRAGFGLLVAQVGKDLVAVADGDRGVACLPSRM